MSTRTAITVVGGVVGAYFGYPQLGFALGALVGSAVDPQQIQGPRIGEVNVQTSQDGAPRTIVYGTVPCYGNVIQSGQVIKVEMEEEGGGKGGPEVTSEHALLTYAIRICEGPIAGVLRIWQDNKLVYDKRPGSAMLAESDKWAANKVFYLGGEDQLPDPTLVATVNEDTPAYRGSAYMVAVLDDITQRRSISQFRFEVAGIVTGAEILSPLVVNDWSGGRPAHDDEGETAYETLAGTEFDDFSAAAAAAASEAVTAGEASALESTKFLGYFTSLVGKPSPFTSGATLAGNPETVTYLLGPVEPEGILWNDSGAISPYVCANLGAENVVVGDGQVVAVWDIDFGIPAPVTWTILSQLFSAAAIPGTGPWSHGWNSCSNYPPVDFLPPFASGTPALSLEVRRVPSPPAGFEKIVGTAKQLCNVEYRDGALYQNALGPVLLPDDPNYSNAAFWSDARDAAITAGLMHSDVGYPVEVEEYAFGTSTVAGLPIPLGLVVSDIHKRCGSFEDTFDVSELVDLVAGLGLAGDYTGASAIDVARPIYNFDKSLHDGKFWYPKRGAAVIETLTVDDLTEIPDTTKREQALDVPRKFHLRYQHAASGYAPVKATAPRTPSPDFLTTGEASFEIPIVLNEDQAAKCADKMYKVMLAEQAGTTEIYVPLDVGAKYAEANCIGLALRGRVDRYRIEQIDFADWKLKFTLKPDRQSAYTSVLTGVPIPPPTLPPSTIVGDTELAVLDIAGRVDSEDSLGIVIGVDGALPPWYGALYRRSLDGGSNYSNVAEITTASVMGVLLDDVSIASEYYTDNTNVVRVQLYRATHSMESITETQFLSEGGGFALQRVDGSWEILQARDWDDEGGGIYAGTVLHRGRLNSGVSEHIAGARFVRLDRPAFFSMQSAWIGQNVTHQAISLGETADDTENEVTLEYAGRSQLEWPVAYLTVERDIADVITGSWYARDRFGTDASPVASANFRGYRVTLDDGVLPAVTFDTLSTSFTYDASALGTPLTVSVSGINRITGAGPATSESI